MSLTISITIIAIGIFLVLPVSWFRPKRSPRPVHFQAISEMGLSENKKLIDLQEYALRSFLLVSFDDAYPATNKSKVRLHFWPEDLDLEYVGEELIVHLSPMGLSIVLRQSMTIRDARQFIRVESGNFVPEDEYRTYNEATEDHLLRFGKAADYDCLPQNVRR